MTNSYLKKKLNKKIRLFHNGVFSFPEENYTAGKRYLRRSSTATDVCSLCVVSSGKMRQTGLELNPSQREELLIRVLINTLFLASFTGLPARALEFSKQIETFLKFCFRQFLSLLYGLFYFFCCRELCVD